MVENVGKASATTFSASIDDIDDLFTPEFQIGFYRITQECLSNILKHAEASEAKVVVRRNGARLQLSVSDNGKGFTTNAAWPACRRRCWALGELKLRGITSSGAIPASAAPGNHYMGSKDCGSWWSWWRSWKLDLLTIFGSID